MITRALFQHLKVAIHTKAIFHSWVGKLKQWYTTLSLLYSEAHWQQVLASWKDIQTGAVVPLTEAFADLALLAETESVFDEQ